jgi:hypothetical protein
LGFICGTGLQFRVQLRRVIKHPVEASWTGSAVRALLIVDTNEQAARLSASPPAPETRQQNHPQSNSSAVDFGTLMPDAP